LAQKLTASFAVKSLNEMVGGANRADGWKIFKSTTFSGGANWETTPRKISSPSALDAMRSFIEAYVQSAARGRLSQ
jgi:hypothetical protein